MIGQQTNPGEVQRTAHQKNRPGNEAGRQTAFEKGAASDQKDRQAKQKCRNPGDIFVI